MEEYFVSFCFGDEEEYIIQSEKQLYKQEEVVDYSRLNAHRPSKN
jgi:hypothetical protein